MAGITTLNADCASDDTQINVVDPSGISDSQLLLIDDEIMIATGFPGEGEVNVTRAIDQTVEEAHTSGTDIYPVVHVAHGGAGITVYYKDSSGTVLARTIVTVAPAIGNVKVVNEPSGAGESLVSLSEVEANWAKGGGSQSAVTVPISSAEILALHDTPKVLIPGVANNVIVVQGIHLVYKPGLVPYLDGGGNIEVNGATDIETEVIFTGPGAGFWDQAAAHVAQQGYGCSLFGDTLAGWEGLPVYLTCDNNPTLGDGTLSATLTYFLAPTS